MRRYALRDDQSVEVMLSEGQDHDLTCAQSLIEAVDPGVLIADKAFDADAFIAALNDRAITPVIPSKSNRKTPRPCDCALYCERDLIERFFNKLKNFRAIATHYDTLARFSSPASSSPGRPSSSTGDTA